MRLARRVIVLAAVVAAGGAALVAQQSVAFRSGVDTVAVYAAVRDGSGHLARGLTQADFEVFDNGEPREITVFSNAVQPITIALLIDRSGSIEGQAKTVTAAASSFIRDLQPEDRASISTLSWDCQPLSTNKDKLTATLGGLFPEDIGSPIWAALDRVISNLGTEVGRRAILMFSDGRDTGFTIDPPARWRVDGPCQPSKGGHNTRFGDVAKRAELEGMITYAVSVEGPGGVARNELEMLSRGSGGQLYHLKNESELAEAFRSIADDLHGQYLIGFVPASFDHQVHSIEVRVKRPDLTVRARLNYLASHDVVPNAEADRLAFESRAPWPELKDEAVNAAIRDGFEGRTSQASCTATGAFPSKRYEQDVPVQVVATGPAGRIMRTANDVHQRRLSFDDRQVTPDMKAAVLVVTADLIVPPVPPMAPNAIVRSLSPPMPAPLASMRLRGRAPTQIELQPALYRTGPPQPPGQVRQTRQLIATFDMGAFKALPGSEVEVLVASPAGERRCSFAVSDVQAIR
jgi:VWFA-related protein